MSEALTSSDDSTKIPPRPGSDDTESSKAIPSAYDLALEDINPINPHLWSQHRWLEYFERLRAEDPVHFNQTDLAGRYWSLTKYADIADELAGCLDTIDFVNNVAPQLADPSQSVERARL